MASALSVDLRERVVAAIEAGASGRHLSERCRSFVPTRRRVVDRDGTAASRQERFKVPWVRRRSSPFDRSFDVVPRCRAVTDEATNHGSATSHRPAPLGQPPPGGVPEPPRGRPPLRGRAPP